MKKDMSVPLTFNFQIQYCILEYKYVKVTNESTKVST